MCVVVVISVHEASARMQDPPDVVYHFVMRPHNVKVEPVWVLPFEVPEKGLAESRCLHHSAHCISFEEGVEFGDCAVQGLGSGSALEVKVHLFWVRGAVARGGDKSGELLSMEGSVLNGGVGEPAK